MDSLILTYRIIQFGDSLFSFVYNDNSLKLYDLSIIAETVRPAPNHRPQFRAPYVFKNILEFLIFTYIE